MRQLILPVVIAALVLAAAAPPSAQVARFVSKREAVRLDVLVTDRGRPLLGLTPADFTVLDNGVPQTVDFVGSDELPLNVIMTLDISGSMTGQAFEDLRAAGHALVDQLRKDDRAALVSFSHALSLGTELTTDMARVRAAIDWSKPGGQTSIVDASFAGLTLGGSEPGRSLMLVFSDGLDTSSWLDPATVIAAAKRTNLVVVGVAVGKSRIPFLKELVEVTAGDLVEGQSTRNLRATFVRLLAEYRQRYIVAYSPTGVTSGGWHKVDVKVSKRGAAIKVREGYQGS